MSRIGIALAGAGLIGRRHIELIRQSGRCELAAIVDPAPAAAVIARQCGVPSYPTLADLFAARRPDAVIAATPNALHAQNGIDCSRAGIPVLIEKPIAASMADAALLLEAAESVRLPLLVGHHRRHSPILAKAREIVRQGGLGRVVAVMGSALFYKPDDYRADPLALQLEHFCAVVRGEASPLVNGRDAMQTLRVTLAIAEAAQTGRIVATSP